MTRRKRQLLNTAEDLRHPGDFGNIAPFEPRRDTVGDLLRRAREGKGLAIDAVAQNLRIRSGYLKAIEEGRFQDLPGLTYAVGFVRTYADHLGLDAEDVVRRFRDEVTELQGQTHLVFPVVAAEGKIPRGAVLLLSAVLLAIAYGGWYYLSEREQSALDLIPELPAKLKALVYGETPEPAAPTGAGSGETAPAATVASAPDAASASASPAASAPVAEAVAPPVAPAAPPAAPEIATPASDASAATVAGADADAMAAAMVSRSADAGGAPVPTATASAAPAPATAATPGTPAPGTPAAGMPTAELPAAEPPPPPAPGTTASTAPAPAPTLDSAGLPTVVAPVPATGGFAAIAPSEPQGLPPVADGQVFGAADAPSRIVLVARLESWVQVTDPESNALLTRVLRAGDRYYVPDMPGLTLATGNAGGLDIWVDGRKLPTLGPVGVVRRGIALDPQRLVDGTALPQ